MAQTRLKQLREEAVLTVHELGEASGVSDDTISKIENGQRVARPSTLRKLADALDVSPQELRRPAKVEEPVPLAKAPREAGQSVAQRLENLQRYEAHISKIAEKYRTEAEPLLSAVGAAAASDADKPTEKDLDSLITLLAQTGWTFDGGYEYLKHDDAVVQAERGTATERHAVDKVKSALNAILDINEAIDAALDPHLDLGEEESRVVTNIQEYLQRRAG
jgi:transcriptional regulator with XRE-family HTH domain